MLSALFPEPMPLVLGGSEWLVSPLRIRDLAYLERWAVLRQGTPWDKLDAALAIEDEHARHEALKAAYDAAERAERSIDDDALDAAIDSPEGGIVVLWRSLRQRHRKFTQADSVLLGAVMDGAEWTAFFRIAWDADPLDAVASAIDREIGVTFPRLADGEPWGRAIVRLMKWSKLSWREVGNLPLPAFRVLYSQAGKRAHPIAEPEPSRRMGWKELDRLVNEPRRVFWGVPGRNGQGYQPVPANGDGTPTGGPETGSCPCGPSA